MINNEPLVSVLMTAYNREKYIAEAIKSVLDSTYTNFELIIVDDCSADNTVAIAREFESVENRIKVYLNECNLGDYPNRNRAASYAKGKYLKYLDSDDTIYPWGLQAMVYCMQKFPMAGFGLMCSGMLHLGSHPLLIQPNEAYSAFFFQNSLFSMGPSGSIIRRDIFELLGGFSGDPYLGDTEMWLKIAQKETLVSMPLDLIWWRQHEGQQMKEEMKNNTVPINRYIIYRKFILSDISPFSESQRLAAIKNLENVRLRDIIFKYFLHFKIKLAISLLRQAGFSSFDLWKALRRNKYPLV